MDSRLIYSASEKLKHLLCWPKATVTEWIYIGAGHEVDTNKVLEQVNDWFAGTSLYIALDRENSLIVDKHNFLPMTSKILGLKSFMVWDTQFDRSIEFDMIGVLRRGTVCR